MEDTQNTTATPESQPPASGVTEDFKTVADRLEREKQGILNDLRAERQSRKELEARLEALERSQPVTASTNTVNSPAPADELDPVLQPKFAQYSAPIMAELNQLRAQQDTEKAFKFIAKNAKVDVEEISPKHPVMQELIEIARQYNLKTGSLSGDVKVAWELREKRMRDAEFAKQAEAEKAKAAEAERQKLISGSQTASAVMPSTTNSGKRTWKSSEIRGMSASEYRNHRADIDAAISEGRYVRD